MFIYHRTRASLSSIAKIYADEPRITADGERAVASDHAPADASLISAENNIPGAFPEHASFAMSDIETVAEAPIAPPQVNNNAVHDDLEQGPLESVVQNAPDGSWIPIPYVFDLNSLTESIRLLLTHHTSHLIEQNLVEVEISGTGQRFLVEKNLLCSQSSFFMTALNGRFMEARTNKISLDDRLDLFQIFYHWLKNGNLNFMDSSWTVQPEKS